MSGMFGMVIRVHRANGRPSASSDESSMLLSVDAVAREAVREARISRRGPANRNGNDGERCIADDLPWVQRSDLTVRDGPMPSRNLIRLRNRKRPHFG